MNILTQAQIGEYLERIIDRATLETVAITIRHICLAKAEHIRSNWQDGSKAADTLARGWVRAAKNAEKLALAATLEHI